MTEAEELNQKIHAARLSDEERRRRDGDFAYGQVVGASFVLDQIGAPQLDGRHLLSVGQRLDAYLEKCARSASITGDQVEAPGRPSR